MERNRNEMKAMLPFYLHVTNDIRTIPQLKQGSKQYKMIKVSKYLLWIVLFIRGLCHRMLRRVLST